MAGDMETLLMGGDSDSDDSDNETAKPPATAAQPKPSATVAPIIPPPSTAAPSNSKGPSTRGASIAGRSELTNRLKSLYSPPAASSGGPPPAAPGAPIQNRGAALAAPPPTPRAPPPASTASGRRPSYMPPTAHVPPNAPSAGGPHSPMVGRVPAPLPKGRATTRPPINRPAASVPVPNMPGPPGNLPPNRQVSDPFEPTPLTTLVARSGSSAGPSQPHPQPRHGVPLTSQYPSHASHPPHHQQHSSLPQQPHPQHPPSHVQQSRNPPMMGPPPPQQPKPQQQQQQQQQQTIQALSAPRPPSHSTGGSSAPVGVVSSQSSAASSSSTLSQQEKKEKEKFLMFTRVLMKYLEQRDKGMHQKAKVLIKDCYEKNKAGDPAYKSLTHSMKGRLRATVGEVYWKKAHDYFDYFVRQKQQEKMQQQNKQVPSGGAQQPIVGRPPSTQPTQSSAAASHSQQPVSGVAGAPSTTPVGPPPPIVRTSPAVTSAGNPTPASSAAPVPVRTLLNQSQAAVAAAKKMPIGAAPVRSGSGVSTSPPPASLSGQSVPSVSAAPDGTAAPGALTPAELKAQKAEEKREAARVKRNADARAKRAAKKHEMSKTAPSVALTAHIPAAGVPSAVVPAPTPSIPTAGVAPVTSATHTVPVTADGVASAMVATTPANTAASATTTAPTAEKKKKKKKKKKIAKSRRPRLKKPTRPATREYNKLVEMVDHAVLIDVKSIPNLLSSEHRLDVNLDNEQQKSIYGEEEQRMKVEKIANAAAKALSSSIKVEKKGTGGAPPLPWKLPTRFRGWGKRNVLSVRAAWAKVRLPESEMLRAEKEQKDDEEKRHKMTMIMPSSSKVALFSIRNDNGSKTTSFSNSETFGEYKPQLVEEDTTNHTWYNEGRAAQDPALALLSEATDLFLRSVIEKAISKARLRQNLDGVRLWHTLHSLHAQPGKNELIPPAYLRLGCDVRRQIALAEGNAAKTCQRMEQAICRRNDTFRSGIPSDPNKMLLDATSMSDFSKMPPLKSAVEDADFDARLRFEVFGGKHGQDPPLGRVPKKAKVMLQDIAMGAVGSQKSMIRSRRKKFKVGAFF